MRLRTRAAGDEVIPREISDKTGDYAAMAQREFWSGDKGAFNSSRFTFNSAYFDQREHPIALPRISYCSNRNRIFVIKAIRLVI